MRIAVKQSGNGTTGKWKQYIGNAAEMARFKKIPRVHSLETEDNYVIRRNETKGS